MKTEKLEILKKLNEIRSRSRVSYLEIRGLDISKITKLEEEQSSRYNDIFDILNNELKKSGEIEAKQQKLSLERRKRLIEKELQAYVELGQAHVYAKDNGSLGPMGFCHCFPWHDTSHEGCSSSTSGTGTVTWTANNSIAHPKVDVSGQIGATNTATAIVQCKFAFTPKIDGTFCISPVTQMNGHWLIWTWGSCAGEGAGSGSVKVTNRVRVEVLSSPIKTVEKVVLNKSTSNGDNGESGFYYDSGNRLDVYLEGGHEATIIVECEAEAKMTDAGRAWVDMQTSPGFYFKAPWAMHGRTICKYPSLGTLNP
jgi:hypothetical protein